jgi:hypothetical protein
VDGTDVRVAVDTLSLRPPPHSPPPSPRLPPVPSPPLGLLGSKRDERVGDLQYGQRLMAYLEMHHKRT